MFVISLSVKALKYMHVLMLSKETLKRETRREGDSKSKITSKVNNFHLKSLKILDLFFHFLFFLQMSVLFVKPQSEILNLRIMFILLLKKIF